MVPFSDTGLRCSFRESDVFRPYVLPPLHGVWPSSHTVCLTFEGIKWERDRISKIRARHSTWNELLYKSLSEHERLGANPGAARVFPRNVGHTSRVGPVDSLWDLLFYRRNNTLN